MDENDVQVNIEEEEKHVYQNNFIEYLLLLLRLFKTIYIANSIDLIVLVST